MPKNIRTGASRTGKKAKTARTARKPSAGKPKGLPHRSKKDREDDKWSAEKWWAETGGCGDMDKLTAKQSNEVIDLGIRMGRIMYTVTSLFPGRRGLAKTDREGRQPKGRRRSR
jgi:hypothetical protein